MGAPGVSVGKRRGHAGAGRAARGEAGGCAPAAGGAVICWRKSSPAPLIALSETRRPAAEPTDDRRERGAAAGSGGSTPLWLRVNSISVSSPSAGRSSGIIPPPTKVVWSIVTSAGSSSPPASTAPALRSQSGVAAPAASCSSWSRCSRSLSTGTCSSPAWSCRSSVDSRGAATPGDIITLLWIDSVGEKKAADASDSEGGGGLIGPCSSAIGGGGGGGGGGASAEAEGAFEPDGPAPDAAAAASSAYS